MRTPRIAANNRRKNLPWLNDSLWQQMKERDSSLKRALKTVDSSDKYTFTGLRNKVLRNIRKAKEDFFY